jgi:hypothetical protein
MLENLKGDQSCDGDSINYYPFNTFIQADIFKENYCLITLFILPWGKAYGVSAGAEKFILR